MIQFIQRIIRDGDVFAGLLPRLLFEAGSIFISKSLVHLYRQQKPAEDETGQVVELIINYATTTCKPTKFDNHKSL